MTAHKILLMVAALSFAGCVENQAPDSTADTTAAASTTTFDTSAAGDEAARHDTLAWTMEAVEEERSVSQVAVVNALRSARHEAYDRFVVEFQSSEIPSYSVEYLEEQPSECGSGHDVDLAGSAALEIRLEPARGHDDRGQSTVDHATRTFDLPVMREADVSCDFEAVFTIALGLEDRLPFRVVELQDPARIAIDVKQNAN